MQNPSFESTGVCASFEMLPGAIACWPASLEVSKSVLLLTGHPVWASWVWKSDGCEWTFQSRINLNIWSFAMLLVFAISVHVAKHHSSLEEAQKPSIIAPRLPPCSYQIIKLSRHWSTCWFIRLLDDGSNSWIQVA